MKNYIFLLFFLFVSAVIVLFIKAMDPFSLNDYTNKDAIGIDFSQTNRELIYPIIYLNKNKKYDCVTVGNSLNSNVIDVFYFYKKTNKNLAKLTVPGLSVEEQYELLKYFLKFHPEIKKAFIPIEVNSFMKIHDKDEILIQSRKEAKLCFIFRLFFSKRAFCASIDKLFSKNSKFVFTPVSDYYLTNLGVKYNYDFMAWHQNIQYFRKIRDLLNKYKIDTVYYFTPLHALNLSNIYYKNQINELENFKRECANITPFYDMAFVNKYTTNINSYFWIDVSHPKYISKQMLNVLYYNNQDKDIAIVINSNNYQEVFDYEREVLNKYINENQNLINEYVNNNSDEYLKYYEKKVFYRDLPSEIINEYNITIN